MRRRKSACSSAYNGSWDARQGLVYVCGHLSRLGKHWTRCRMFSIYVGRYTWTRSSMCLVCPIFNLSLSHSISTSELRLTAPKNASVNFKLGPLDVEMEKL